MTLVPPDLDQPVFRTADKTVVLKLLPWRNAMGERNESERQGFSEAERTELTIVSGGSTWEKIIDWVRKNLPGCTGVVLRAE